MFFRLHTDGTPTAVALEHAFAGPTSTACWLIGGGPSLASLPTDAIARSPLPKMAINLAGAKLLRPTFWTSYDPSARFHKSIYLDPSVLKFVHRRRAMDLIPESTFKVCDAPATFFFDRDPQRGFADFLAPQHTTVVDWADSFVQAIDILYRLGFRTLYLAGCELRIQPSTAQIQRANALGVEHAPCGRLDEWLVACRKAGLSDADLDLLDPAPQYHFDEFKPIATAANTDLHYFRIVQYLRLSRRSLALAGMQLVSVTPHSRLNDHFRYTPIETVLDRLAQTIGDPTQEPVRGLYRQTAPRQPEHLGPMPDHRPHNWPRKKPLPSAAVPSPRAVPSASSQPASSTARNRTARTTNPNSTSPELLVEHEGPHLYLPSEPELPTPQARLAQALDNLPPHLPAPDEQPL